MISLRRSYSTEYFLMAASEELYVFFQCILMMLVCFLWYCTKKFSFPLRISSVNVTKSAGNCVYGHIYWRYPQWKASFFVRCDRCKIAWSPRVLIDNYCSIKFYCVSNKVPSCLSNEIPVLPWYRNKSIDLQWELIDWFLYEGNTCI